MCVQLLDSDLQQATKVQKVSQPGGHAPSDIVLLRHPTVLLRLFIMSFLRFGGNKNIEKGKKYVAKSSAAVSGSARIRELQNKSHNKNKNKYIIFQALIKCNIIDNEVVIIRE